MAERLPVLLAAILAVAAITACTSQAAPPQPSTSPNAAAVQPIGEPRVIASGLEAPWSILRLGDHDSTLISERDTGVIVELTASKGLRDAGTVGGVVHDGEGGLLGLETLRDGPRRWIYAYLTTASDNRIVRMPLLGEAGNYSLGPQQKILTGLAKAANHDGGRIKFGPDGILYATVGDAGQTDRAQDPESLNGKILRMTPSGGVPGDNPTTGSLVYSMGHRNPQGLAWDSGGQLWAAEFGQNTWDELNRIEPGGNYGWPIVEGSGGRSGLIDPVYQWSTAEASPSGLTFVDGTFFLAALRGERLWAIYPGATTSATAYLVGTLGRIRDAVPGPGNTLWLLTNNTDGRGSPHEGDDKLVQLDLGVAREG
ncbi:MAG: glucose dehydrogenase [Microbacteriaceae bacterium]|nr:glucose dehydrogenase [Microbacteriaceae bacterium]